MLLLRFVAFADPPRPIIMAVKMQLFPDPLWPRMKFIRGLKSNLKLAWHMKFFKLMCRSFPAVISSTLSTSLGRLRFWDDGPALD